jgi:putative hydrolase of the HAD superfamily
MAKAFIFDLDNTLYDTRAQVKAARENALRAMISAGLKATEEEAIKALTIVVKDRGPNFSRHFDEMFSVLGVEYNPKVVAAGTIAYHEARTAHLVPYSDTVPTLIALRESGYKVGVVTEGVPVKQWAKLIWLGLGDFFHTVVVASDEKTRKPSPKAYLEAAKNLNLRPSDCVVVGDRLDKDIAGAKKAGMISVQLVRESAAIISPSGSDETPDYLIGKLEDLLLLAKIT